MTKKKTSKRKVNKVVKSVRHDKYAPKPAGVKHDKHAPKAKNIIQREQSKE